MECMVAGNPVLCATRRNEPLALGFAGLLVRIVQTQKSRLILYATLGVFFLTSVLRLDMYHMEVHVSGY
jgi:hypothetical protein